jgi:hypothetical protein
MVKAMLISFSCFVNRREGNTRSRLAELRDVAQHIFSLVEVADSVLQLVLLILADPRSLCDSAGKVSAGCRWLRLLWLWVALTNSASVHI